VTVVSDGDGRQTLKAGGRWEAVQDRWGGAVGADGRAALAQQLLMTDFAKGRRRSAVGVKGG